MVRFTTGVAVSCVALPLVFLATSAAAASKPQPITGKLSRPGYTVVALAPSGNATAVRARRGRFRVRPLSDTVTLELRAPDGKYVGPVVAGRKGSYAILGVRAGARLGKVRVRARKGFARVARRLPRRRRDASRLARTRHGVPLGAGNYGFVRSRPIRAAAAAGTGLPGGDRDADGVPNALDIAAHGDLRLNVLRRPRRARSAQVEDCATYDCTAGFEVGTHLMLPLEETVNVNALPGLADDALTALMDETLKRHLFLDLSVGSPGIHAELNCGAPQQRTNPALGGLSYCTRGGTGRIIDFNNAREAPFPECCDPDSNGFGALDSAPGNFNHSTSLRPGATAAEIGSGDQLIAHVTKGVPGNTGPGDHATTLQFVFATTPALVSYSDTAGNCAKVAGTPGSCATEFSYPVPPPGSDCSRPGCPGGLGTGGNGFPVAPGPNNKIKVTLTFWRPQRAPIPSGGTGGGDPCLPGCEWVDIGNLDYTTAFDGEGGPACPRGAYSNSDLSVGSAGRFPPPHDPGILSDTVGTKAASPANTFTYTVDLSECLADPQGGGGPGEGPAPKPLRWDSGEDRAVALTGTVPDATLNVEFATTTVLYFRLR